MFNINLLGAPGIQPDTVEDSISFRKIELEDKGKMNFKLVPDFVKEIHQFIKNKYDWLSFLIISILIIIALGPGGDYLGISEPQLSMDERIAMNYQTISIIINAIENLDEKVTLQKFNLRSKELKLELFSDNQDRLLSISNKLQSCPDAIIRFYGDSISTFGLILALPWNIYSDYESQIVPVHSYGDFEFVLLTIHQMIEENKLHQGSLVLEHNTENNYRMEFTPILDK